jgi:hypothetical protein
MASIIRSAWEWHKKHPEGYKDEQQASTLSEDG